MKRENIICVSMTTWEGDYMKAVVHMMGHLAKNHQVLFIDYAFTIKDLLKGLLGQANIPVKSMLGLAPRLKEIKYKDNKLYHLTLPPVLPINWINNDKIHDFIMNLQIGLISKFCIKGLLRILKFDDPIIINAFNPSTGVAMQKTLHSSKTIYYCYDEIGAADWCKKHSKRLESQFAKSVDLIVVTSTALLESKSKLNQNTLLIKNGVDFKLFNNTCLLRKSLPRKQVGYIGSIDFRIDFDLLDSIIKSLPSHDFQFIGRIVDQKSCNKLKKYSNITFLGAMPPEHLPPILAQIDIAIIPFNKNEFTRNIYPLKINEYLAAGLPVVSTDFADMSDFKEIISIENESKSFVEAIITSIQETSNRQSDRVEMAKKNDWSSRVNQLEEAIAQLNPD